MAEQYDLASGFQTLIRSNEAIAAEIKGLRSTITASMDMASKYAGQGGSPSQRGTQPGARPTPDATAGQTKAAGGGQATFDGIRQAAMGYVMERGARAAQPSAGPFAPGGRFGGGQGGWAPPGPGAAGGAAGGSGGPPVGSTRTAAGAGGGGGGLTSSQAPPEAGGESWITQHIPGAGIVTGALGSLRDQQDKNNYYRNIEGGTHGNAMGERLREEGYAFGSSMVFGGDEARQAYKGVTRIGYTNRTDQRSGGTTRAQALDYVYEGKKSRGQSVDEGLMQLEVASRSLSTSLSGLNDSMERVSESAGKAGVNTEMARRQMLTAMSAGIAKGQGAGATGFAEAVVSTNVSYGRDYASQVNSSKMYSRDFEYRAAAMSGMTAGALRNQQRRDPAGAMGAMQKVMDQSLSSAGITPEMKSWIKQRVDTAGGADALRNQPELANIIGGEFLDQFLDKMDPNAFTDVVGQLAGQDFGGNVEMAARFLVEQVGGNTMAANAKKNQMQVGLTDAKGKMADGTKNAGVSSSIDKFDDLTHTARAASYLGRSYQSDAAKAYIKGSEKSGKRDPIMEALLQNEAVMGGKGNDTKVEVQTKSGGRVMSLKDAIKEFPNQVASGKAKVVEGEDGIIGQSTADLAGGKADLSRDWKSEVQKDTKTGKSTAEWQRDQGKGLGSGDAKIGLTPEAAKLVTILNQGGSTGAAAAFGVPPNNSGNASRVGAPQ